MSKNNYKVRYESIVIERGLTLLKRGLLASVLPEKLADEFGILPAQAKRLAQRAINLWAASNE